jgi:non-specific serine/threonine protein kinase/serine/threonine-protein kinase
VFQAALTRAPESRSAFLDEACGGDGELRGEVDRLLAAHAAAGDFLSSPIGLDADGADEARVPGAGPQRIGPYRILDTIAQGGMGTVYRSVRDDDAFRKTVALKVVRGERRSDDFERRFRQERRIVALLQHPNIASVLDGGTTEDGQAYLVMEYVEGLPITEFCARQGLGSRERVALFRAVCDAVHYAHQNLVVHRDIKPGNVLVDGRGVPKLLDFGIAKMLAAGVDPELAPTATVLPVMTPDYASPEQVRGQTVTTASDVYSLGVLLYELLAGRRPYEVNADSLEAIVQAVCQTEPKAPSEAAREEAARTTRPPGTRPPASELRGDLDTIVLKALRKEPARRYSSVHELSEDLRRHLEGLPVHARADTLGYRAGKFVRRHRTAVAAASIVVLALVGGLLATVRQRRIAERRFDEVRSLATFVMFDMHDAIENLPGSTPARKRLVERALQYLDSLAAEASADPSLRAEIARGYQRLAIIQGTPGKANLGDRAGALASTRKAIAIREQLAARAPADRIGADLAVSYGDMVRIFFSDKRNEEAHTALDKMKAALDSVPAAHAQDRNVLYAWENYHALAAMKAELAADLEGLRDARVRQLEVAQQRLALEPASLVRQRNVALAHKYLGGAFHRLHEYERAVEQGEEALRLDRAGVEAEPMNAGRKLDLSFSHGTLGAAWRDQGKLDRALEAYGEALALRQEVQTADPVNEFAFKSLVGGHHSLAEVSALKGDLDGVRSHVERVLALRRTWETSHRSRYGNAEWQARYHWDLGEYRALMAGRAGTPPSARAHWQAARADYARSLALWRELAARKPLEGEYAGVLKLLQDAVARCDATMARLGAIAGPPP